MKKITLLFTFMLSVMVFGQMPTSTEKYNSSLERYEYYDNNGTLIGYRKWNASLKRWENFEVKQLNKDYVQAKTRDRNVPDLGSPALSSSEIEYARAMAQARAAQQSQSQDNQYIPESIRRAAERKVAAQMEQTRQQNEQYKQELAEKQKKRMLETEYMNNISEILDLDNKLNEFIDKKFNIFFKLHTATNSEINKLSPYGNDIINYLGHRRMLSKHLTEDTLTAENSKKILDDMIVIFNNIIKK